MIFLFIGGQSGAGKTSLSHALKTKYGNDAVIINMDDYFKERPEERDAKEYRLNTIFDTPEMLNLEKLFEQLSALKNNIPIDKPIFDFESNRCTSTERINPTQVIIVEGIFAQYFYKHYIESENWPALSINTGTESYLEIIKRRCLRDQAYRGLSEADVLKNERSYVAPGFFKYTASSATQSHIHVMIPTVKFEKQLTSISIADIKAFLAFHQEEITAAIAPTVQEIADAIAKLNDATNHNFSAVKLSDSKETPGQTLIRRSHEEYHHTINEKAPELHFCGLFDSRSSGCKAVLKARLPNEESPASNIEIGLELAQSSKI